MSNISAQILALKDLLAVGIFGITIAEAKAQGICIDCQKAALPNCYSSAGRKEYEISGLCEKCFDKLNKPKKDYWRKGK